MLSQAAVSSTSGLGLRVLEYIAARVPSWTIRPTISGTPIQGQTLYATTGTWTNSPTTYSYAWISSSNSNGPGSVVGTGSSYVVNLPLFYYIRVEVTATNSYGSSTAGSNSVQRN